MATPPGPVEGLPSATGGGVGSRLRRARYQVLVRLSSIAHQATSAWRLTLTLLAVVAVVFGAWGRLLYRDQHPEAQLDAGLMVHGTMGLFTVAGEVEPVPWPLALARILAPLATAAVIVELVLVLFANLLRTRAASRAVDHLVVVGPPERVRPYLRADAPIEPFERPSIHLHRAPGSQEADTIRLVDEGSAAEWIAAANAARARRTVLATGDDDRNLASMTAALDAGIPAPGRQLVVELDDAALAQRLSVDLAVGRPDADVEVVCTDDARAAYAADRIVAHLRGQADPTPTFTIVGDSALSERLVAHMARELGALGRQTGRTCPRLEVVGVHAAPLRRAAIEHHLADATGLRGGLHRGPSRRPGLHGPPPHRHGRLRR